MDNCLLYDWVSATLPEDGLYYHDYGEDISDGHVIIELLGLTGVTFEVSKGVRGYSQKLWFDGINLHLPSENQHNVWLEMSGSGCRAFETYGNGDWDRLFSFLMKYCHITRLDVSFDDHSGILDMHRLVDDTFFTPSFVSRANKHKLEMETDDRTAGDACTIYHGSRQSNIMIRIYDKAAQLNRDDHWVRVEMELHDDNAVGFLKLDQNIGDKWSGVLLNYLRYVDPDLSDKNKWRWPLKSYWANLVLDAQPLRIAAKPGVSYNLLNLENYVLTQAGNSVWTYIKIVGLDKFLENLKLSRKSIPDKYIALIRQYCGAVV